MNQKEIEQKTDETLRAWDGIKPAEVSPFLWTRIRSNLFAEAEPKRLIAQPALRIYLGIWLVLIVAHAAFWLSGTSRSVPDSTSAEVRTVFFSDDNPYSSY